MSASSWFCHYQTDPYFNMAFDECMLGCVLRCPDAVLLRLYTWNPGAVTIGVHQAPGKAILMSRLGDTPLIRRITGGRAVYHDVSELTYSVALSLDNPALCQWRGSVNTIYLRLAEGLCRFLAEVGTTTQIVRHSSGASPESVKNSVRPCFVSAARYELQAEGAKIVGSAQRQVGPAVLQHGAIKLKGLVSHPALPGAEAAPDYPCQPYERSHVERFAAQFAGVFSEVFGVPITRPETSLPSDDLLAGLDERCRLIRSAPLAHRDPIERDLKMNSL